MDHKIFSLFFNLFTELCNQFCGQELIDQKLDDLLSEDVPGVSTSLWVLHVERYEEVLDVRVLDRVDLDVYSHEACLLTLHDI